MRAVELFAGAGGLALGVSRAGFSPVAVVERDRWCCDTIRRNRARAGSCIAHWPDPLETDVRSIDFRPFEGKLDLVAGGPPCQPFSLGGKHAAQDDARDMWGEAARVLREARPAAFLFENVKGLTRARFAAYFDYVVARMRAPYLTRAAGEGWSGHAERLTRHLADIRPGRRGGYTVVHAVLNAADHGVPQRRERVVLVGFRDDLDVAWRFPAPTHSREALSRDQGPGGSYWDRLRVPMAERREVGRSEARAATGAGSDARPWRTLREAIADLPDPEHDPAAASVPNHRFQPGARVYPGHTGSPLDRPAKTLKAGVHGVPGGENMLVRPDGTVRYLTVREAARLQTFPDEFHFPGSWTETMRQLGNAVPVRLAEVVAGSIAAALARDTAARAA